MYKWLLLLLVFPVLAADLQREERWANQVIDAILVGEPEWLAIEDHKFLAIYTAGESETPRGAVILVHGLGVHPDWPDVINPLRERLPEHGWATLSLQMPVLNAGAEIDEYFPVFPEALPRIDAGVRFLKDKGFKTIVIAGHSLGSQMAAYRLSQAGDAGLQGFIAIGMSGREREGHGSTLDYLATINVPTLDIFGEHDLDTVNASSAARASAAKRAGNSDYVQVEVEGADHMFQGYDEPLVAEVVKWLGKFH
jgi:pimeloyl-ACP methyl ester carboxylesterase